MKLATDTWRFPCRSLGLNPISPLICGYKVNAFVTFFFVQFRHRKPVFISSLFRGKGRPVFMFNLLPKDTKFYDELERLSSLVASATQHLETIVDQFPKLDGEVDVIERSRLDARKVFQESLLRLDQAFITPLDREDILNLITEMDGVVDRVAELSQRFRLYRIDKLYPTLTNQSKNLSSIAKQLDEIIHGLRKKQKLKDMKPGLDAVSATMELVRRDREQFLQNLFSENAEALDVLKKKELHDLLENAIERCEGACETMARVLLKNG